MPQVTFNEIFPTKVPGVYCEIDNSLANSGLPGKEAVGLLIGQKLAAGTIDHNIISPLITNADQAVSLVGEGSELHRMATAWLENNKNNRLYMIAVNQTSGTEAKYTIKVLAPSAVKAGMVNLYIAGRAVRFTVEENMTAAQIATGLVALINANPMIPVTATATEGTLTLTAKHKGTAGNLVDLRLNYYQGETTAAGVSVEFTAGAEGAGNASLAESIAALGDEYFTDIVTSYTDAANMMLLKTELTRRFGAMVNNESIVYYGVKGTLNEMLTAINGVNHQCVTAVMDYKSPNMPEERAARYGAIAAMEFQKDPARQIASLLLSGDLPALEGLTKEERNMLLNAGIATIKTDAAGNTLIEREATSYRKNAQGVKDESYFDLPTTKTVIYLRYSYVARMLSKFPRHKLVDDSYEIEPGQDNIAKPSTVAAELIALAHDWQTAGLVEDISGFVKTLVSVRDASDKERVNQLFQPNIVNNLRVIAGKLQFIL